MRTAGSTSRPLLYSPTWCIAAHCAYTTSLRCRAESQKDAQTARERLRANPAYQRLKKSSWKDSYKPTDGGKSPGPVPKHFLEDEEGRTLSKQVQGSIVERWQDQAGTSGRREEAPEPAQQASGEAGLRAQAREAQSAQGAGLQTISTQPHRHVRVTRVKFWIQFHAQFGQRMRIVGSHEQLGAWDLKRGVELVWSSEDRWNAIVELPAGAIVEYKYVWLEGDGARAIAWQAGNNSVLAVGHAGEDVEVHDTWQAAPGAAVTAGGETTTREGRLLSWASEVEALFASQRSELRKSRMELVAAQDEARLAREEARQFRLELRASEAERIKADMKVKELTSANRLLRTQLADTTLSFRNALEKTRLFLLEAEKAMLSQKDATGSTDGIPDAPSSPGGHSLEAITPVASTAAVPAEYADSPSSNGAVPAESSSASSLPPPTSAATSSPLGGKEADSPVGNTADGDVSVEQAPKSRRPRKKAAAGASAAASKPKRVRQAATKNPAPDGAAPSRQPRRRKASQEPPEDAPAITPTSGDLPTMLESVKRADSNGSEAATPAASASNGRTHEPVLPVH